MEFSLDFSPELLVAFLTLFVLEVVLGVDNVIFISILASKLPKEQQAKARNLGLSLAMIIRIGLLFAASWIISLKADLFTILGMGFSGRDLILIFGGLFLIYKAVKEIHEKLEGAEPGHGTKAARANFGAVIVQILLLDIVFSFDSVITAVGMIDNLLVIIAAVVLSFGIMLFSSRFIFSFVNKHPSVKILALSFLVMIGVFLIVDGFGVKVDKALIYVPMAFAIGVEALNLVYRGRQRRKLDQPDDAVHLRNAASRADDQEALAAANGESDGSVGLSNRPVSGSQSQDRSYP
ncbi:TerC family protein [Microlunatus parietis]|uniref:Putative tellurium resistance membrane protein TerC n=1 Tax=Microlunatus parietis TaxID=682979 RepID=A0A7Y9I8G6_9ACTN|nr:TerC family protein [Microlunatus parietis]NYE72243.1 putative tellurium resistance membrane protein TerC [Microlunatus parietis]